MIAGIRFFAETSPGGFKFCNVLFGTEIVCFFVLIFKKISDFTQGGCGNRAWSYTPPKDRETTRRKTRSKPKRHFAIIGCAHCENEDRETTRRKTRSKPTRHFAIIGCAHCENEDRETTRLQATVQPTFFIPLKFDRNFFLLFLESYIRFCCGFHNYCFRSVR